MTTATSHMRSPARADRPVVSTSTTAYVRLRSDWFLATSIDILFLAGLPLFEGHSTSVISILPVSIALFPQRGFEPPRHQGYFRFRITEGTESAEVIIGGWLTLMRYERRRVILETGILP